MKTDVLLMTLSSLLIWIATAARWLTAGSDWLTYLLLYLSVGAVFALSMCADLLRTRQAERSTVLIMWVTKTLTWLPWNLTYASRTLHRIYTGDDTPWTETH